MGVITINGELSIFVQEFDLLYKELTAYIKMGLYQYVLDLNQVSYIDSSGIGMVIKLATNASKFNTQICILCDQPQVRKALTISNVDKIVHYIKSVKEGSDYYKNTNIK